MSAASGFDADAIAAIQRFAGLGAAAEPVKAPKAPKAAPAFTPKAAAPLPEGFRLFSAVFGWAPTHVPVDVPVRVFVDGDWPSEVQPYIPATLPNGGLWHWPCTPVTGPWSTAPPARVSLPLWKRGPT